MHALALNRRADEVAIGTEGPAVIDAFVNLRITAIGGADAHAPVRADVEVYEYLTFFAAGNNDRVGTHVTDHEIAGVRDFRLVPQEHPDLAEDLFHLQVVDFVVRQHTHLHFPAGGIDEI
ncbi:hypothetical protein D3C80_952460 [compost metagenome]